MKHVTEDLAAYLAGELTAERMDAVSDHLDTCPSCRAERDRMGKVWDLLGEVAAAPAPQAIGSVWPAVRARTTAAPAPRPGVGFGWAAVAVAAGIMVAVLLPVGSRVPATDTALAAAEEDSWLESTWLQSDTEGLAEGWLLAGRDENGDES